MATPPSRRRRVLPAAVLLAATLSLTACQGTELVGGDGDQPTTLVASETYTRSGSDGSAAEQLASLQSAIDRLRSETGSGWTGRQDDVTGYLAELAGGRYFAGSGDSAKAVVQAFLRQYGPSLFGVDAAALRLGTPTATTAAGTATIRAEQVIGRVPVLDGGLTFTLGDVDGEPRLTAVRGRAFPGLDVDTDPSVSRARAEGIARRLSGGEVLGESRLVVMTGGTGQLVWEVTVAGLTGGGQGGGSSTGISDGIYYLSATTGDLVSLRPGTSDATLVPSTAAAQQRPARRGPIRALAQRAGSPASGASVASVAGNAAAEGAPVEVSGSGPNGEPLTAQGMQQGTGVLLKDTTVPTYDPASDEGAVQVFDVAGSEDQSSLPGDPFVSESSEVTDPDALAAQTYSRAVYDYFNEVHGRASWDGEGGSLISTVNFGGGDFCNAFFSSALRQMVYGNPCEGPGGAGQLVTIDVTGHEITHGVTETSSGLLYIGQSGALDESFADYFGNVIGNRVKGTDDSTLGEDLCAGVDSPQVLCSPSADGTLATRELLNGTAYDDYLRLLAPGFRLRLLRDYDQDSGGVHLNSAIWNNTLWTIRTRLAQVDGVSGNESELAAQFDSAVYTALTTLLGPTSSFVDARSAIEQAIRDNGSDPTVSSVAQEVFDLNDICAGCAGSDATPATGVSTTSQSQVAPAVSGDRVAWLDLDNDSFLGNASSSAFDGSGSQSTDAPETAQVVFAGEAVITLDSSGEVLRHDDAGSAVLAEENFFETAARGLAGSEEGAAWVSFNEEALKYVDAAGEVTTVPLTVDPLSLATGAGIVGLGGADGGVYAWRIADGPEGELVELGAMDEAVLSLAAYGDKVLAVDEGGAVALFGLDGSRVDLSDDGMWFGAAMNDEYAVWTNQVGMLGGGVAESLGTSIPDTDLYLYSFATGTIYDILPSPGQQGFPALSGDRLVWQDTLLEGDDVLTGTIPSGL